MKNVKYGKCVRCGKTYEATPDLTNCQCGGILDIVYDYDYIKSVLTKEKLARRENRSMWRYRELLPIEETTEPTPLRVGWSPLYEEQRLAEQDAAGRVVEMGGDGFPRPAQGSPRLFGFSRVEAGEGGADAFQRRIPGNGGVARRCGLPGNGFGPQGAEPPKADFFQIGLQRFVLRRERALFRMQGGESRRIRSLYEMKRITHSCTFGEMARRRWGREGKLLCYRIPAPNIP